MRPLAPRWSPAFRRTLVALAPFFVLADVALAANGAGGGGCCSLVWVVLFTAAYRGGGVDWPLALGTAFLPGIFGWFIWRNRDYSTGARVLALVMAILHALFFVLGLIAAAFAGQMLKAKIAEVAGISAFDTRAQFIGRCAEQSPTRVCSCIADAAQDRTESDRLTLASGKEAGPLAAWLEAQRQECATKTGLPAVGGVDVGVFPTSKVDSEPPGARVFVNGEERGKTPLETKLAAGKNNEVRVELDGYFPDSQFRMPNANEHLTLTFPLKPAAIVKVTSTPPGARVLVGMKEVLAKTPGRTAPLEKGETELLVVLDGYQPHVEKVDLPLGESSLEVQLTQGIVLTVTSAPEAGAEVWVDGQLVGLTPASIAVASKSKPTVEVKKEGWGGAVKKFGPMTKPQTFAVTLVDVERKAANAALARARARYDKANAALEKQQKKMEFMNNPPAKLVKELEKLEKVMEGAAAELEKAELALKQIDEERPLPVAPKKPDDE
ncbi:MAG: PEGA domain-containing protein [Myxococcaceae bacterium]